MNEKWKREEPKNIRRWPWRRLGWTGIELGRVAFVIIDVPLMHIVNQSLDSIAACCRMWEETIAKRSTTQARNKVVLCSCLQGTRLATLEHFFGVHLVMFCVPVHFLWKLRTLEDQAMHLYRAKSFIFQASLPMLLFKF